jgi:hypothetical protein
VKNGQNRFFFYRFLPFGVVPNRKFSTSQILVWFGFFGKSQISGGLTMINNDIDIRESRHVRAWKMCNKLFWMIVKSLFYEFF